MCVYAWGNNIFNNPGISYNKAHRADQEARDDDPNSLARSKRYTSGIFRRLGDVRACFPRGTGCLTVLLEGPQVRRVCACCEAERRQRQSPACKLTERQCRWVPC